MKITYTLKEVLIFCLFVILVAYPFTEFLGKLPLRLWDESRQAANAIDMYTNHQWFVTYYDGHSDTWNTKPPLLIWLQVIFMHLLGVSVTSLRLVSAIAGILTVIILFHFVKKQTSNTGLAFFSGIALTCMEGFNGYHAARTADYDALLTLFSLLCITQFYFYIESANKKNILLFFLFLALSWMTKSISSLLFLPGFFLYACLEKKTLLILKDRYFYLGLFSFLTSIGLYYTVRESLDPGYLLNVYNNEIGGRYLEVTEGHRGGIFFYLQFLVKNQTYIWFHVLLFTLIFLPFFHSNLIHKKLFHYLFLLTIAFVVVLNSSQTKIEWYIVPALPLMAALTILLLFNLIYSLSTKLKLNEDRGKSIAFGMISLLSVIAYINIVQLNYHPEDDEYQKRLNTLSSFFQEEKNPTTIPNLKIAIPDIKQHLYFYVKKLKLSDPGADFADYTRLKKGDHVITYDEKISDYIRTNYSTDELYREEPIFIYSIK